MSASMNISTAARASTTTTMPPGILKLPRKDSFGGIHVMVSNSSNLEGEISIVRTVYCMDGHGESANNICDGSMTVLWPLSMKSVELELWPPQVPFEIVGYRAELHPTPWPSFNMVDGSSGRWSCSGSPHGHLQLNNISDLSLLKYCAILGMHDAIISESDTVALGFWSYVPCKCSGTSYHFIYTAEVWWCLWICLA
uniref:Uncharacterized protein n=1 Tax=Arundo donax TaxID=35708 RepID=A0A0A9EIZ5_ARUDO